jgi:hypothetical protein
MNVNRIAPCAVALALAACGGSDNNGNNGGGTAGTTGVTGTVAGLAFTGKEALSAVVPPTTCTVRGVSASVASLVIGVSSVTGTCSLASNACTAKANAQGLVLAVANVSPFGPASPIGPGTYTISPLSSPSNSLQQAFAFLGRTDASCSDVASTPDATGGTVTITSVSATSASGTVNVTFADGSTLTGPFTTTSCSGLQVDPCSATVSGFGGGSCTGTPVCTP